MGLDVPGNVRRADRAQRGRIWGMGGHGYPAGLAGGDLVQQPDGQPGVAGAVAAVGLGEHPRGLAGGRGGEREPGLTGQDGEDAGELGGGVAGEVDDRGEAGGRSAPSSSTPPAPAGGTAPAIRAAARRAWPSWAPPRRAAGNWPTSAPRSPAAHGKAWPRCTRGPPSPAGWNGSSRWNGEKPSTGSRGRKTYANGTLATSAHAPR